jgi:hypothetical protein
MRRLSLGVPNPKAVEQQHLSSGRVDLHRWVDIAPFRLFDLEQAISKLTHGSSRVQIRAKSQLGSLKIYAY